MVVTKVVPAVGNSVATQLRPNWDKAKIPVTRFFPVIVSCKFGFAFDCSVGTKTRTAGSGHSLPTQSVLPGAPVAPPSSSLFAQGSAVFPFNN
jgi:hypothetical protein